VEGFPEGIGNAAKLDAANNYLAVQKRALGKWLDQTAISSKLTYQYPSGGRASFRIAEAHPASRLAECNERQDRIAVSDLRPPEQYYTAPTRQEGDSPCMEGVRIESQSF
jgi:hypothetical protein